MKIFLVMLICRIEYMAIVSGRGLKEENVQPESDAEMRALGLLVGGQDTGCVM